MSQRKTDMKSVTDDKLEALLERFRRLAKQLAQTRSDSAETRKFAEAVQRHIERARSALQMPPLRSRSSSSWPRLAHKLR